MTNSIYDEMVKQSADMGYYNFVCEHCKNYEGNLRCSKGVFIAFVGANMRNCYYYRLGRKCPYCCRIS